MSTEKIVFLQVRNPLTVEQQEIVRQHYLANGIAPDTVFSFLEVMPESGAQLLEQCQAARETAALVHPVLTEKPLPTEAMAAGFVPLVLIGDQLYYLKAVVPDLQPFFVLQPD